MKVGSVNIVAFDSFVTLPKLKLAAVSVLVETLPLASVTKPLVFVVILKSKSEITVAPVNAPVSTSISSPAKLVGKV